MIYLFNKNSKEDSKGFMVLIFSLILIGLYYFYQTLNKDKTLFQLYFILYSFLQSKSILEDKNIVKKIIL